MNCYSVIGLGFGDEGKGTIVDYLCSKNPNIKYCIRFNGGPQAAHNVVTNNNIHHTFSSFCSGMFYNNVRTHLMESVIIEPMNIMNEADVLSNKGVRDIYERFTISPYARIITPWNKMVNQIEELSQNNSKGSVGMGVGNVILDYLNDKNSVVYFNDLFNLKLLKKKLESIYYYKFDHIKSIIKNLDNPSAIDMINERVYYFKQYDIKKVIDIYKMFLLKGDFVKDDWEIFDDIYDNNVDAIFEGAQGSLLDPEYGFKPHVTLSSCNSKSLEEYLRLHKDMLNVKHIGVIRGFYTRHGNGPFITEMSNDEICKSLMDGEDNGSNRWQGKFRYGHFDMVMLKYALSFNNISHLAITCLDRLVDSSIRICSSYSEGLKPNYTMKFNFERYKGNSIFDDYIQFIGDNINCNIGIVSVGKKSENKINMMEL